MQPKKLELTKKQLECMRLLGKIFADKNIALTENQKQNLADFLEKCIGQLQRGINKVVFNNKGHLVHSGVEIVAINFVLDVTFKTRDFDQYEATLQSNLNKSPRETLDEVKLFAFYKNYHVLHDKLTKLAQAGVCAYSDRLVDLHEKCRHANEFIGSFEDFADAEIKLAKRKSQPGLFGGSSTHSEIIVFFQLIEKFSTTRDLKNGFHPES